MTYRTGTKVTVTNQLAAIGQHTPAGTVGRVLPKGQRGLMESVPGWTAIETVDGKRWTVRDADIEKVVR